ncbi:Plastocyanin [Rhizobiales bacterium GAS113]|nr:Plastocyanin [Rhizobiales bacterium GAS113]
MSAVVYRRKLCGSTFFAVVLLVATQASASEVIRIKIDKLAFSPAQASAHVGDTIEWSNADFVAHTATETHGAWDVIIPAGATRRLVLRESGAVDYYCRFHPNMKGQLHVDTK